MLIGYLCGPVAAGGRLIQPSNMSNILETIVAHKRQEVARAKELIPLEQLEQQSYFTRAGLSLKARLNTGRPGIIAEFKRRSPSKGVLHASARPEVVAPGYVAAGAAGVSILTDAEFFGGSEADLMSARPRVAAPILRKDFVIDPYQIAEAKAMGADVVLLIAAILSPAEVEQLAQYAHQLGLEVLLEVHDADELARSLNDHIDMVGVNNRNLKTFEVSLDTSHHLAALIPPLMIKVSESGISLPEHVAALVASGYQGFLVGENFMKQPVPEAACQAFINSL